MAIWGSGSWNRMENESAVTLRALESPICTLIRLRKLSTLSSANMSAEPGSENSLNFPITRSRLLRLMICWESVLMRLSMYPSTTGLTIFSGTR